MYLWPHEFLMMKGLLTDGGERKALREFDPDSSEGTDFTYHDDPSQAGEESDTFSEPQNTIGEDFGGPKKEKEDQRKKARHKKERSVDSSEEHASPEPRSMYAAGLDAVQTTGAAATAGSVCAAGDVGAAGAAAAPVSASAACSIGAAGAAVKACRAGAASVADVVGDGGAADSPGGAGAACALDTAGAAGAS